MLSFFKRKPQRTLPQEPLQPIALAEKSPVREMIPYGEIEPLAQHFAKSGLFKDVGEFSQAVVKITAGRELGLSPFAAMQGIYFVKKEGGGGALQIGYVALLALLTSHGVEFRYLQKTAEMCEIEFSFRGRKMTESFSIVQAKHYIPQGEKGRFSPWVKSPENMLVARCVSNAAKFHFPWIFNGVSIYTEGDDFAAESQSVQATRFSVSPTPTPIVAARAYLVKGKKPDSIKILENEIRGWLGEAISAFKFRNTAAYGSLHDMYAAAKISGDWQAAETNLLDMLKLAMENFPDSRIEVADAAENQYYQEMDRDVYALKDGRK